MTDLCKEDKLTICKMFGNLDMKSIMFHVYVREMNRKQIQD